MQTNTQIPTPIEQFECTRFSAPSSKGRSLTFDIYTRGEGKIVIILQELPGIGQQTLRLADQFVARGYRVILPHFFGPIGKLSVVNNTLRVLCMRKAFRLLSKNLTSPIVAWLKALCLEVTQRYNVTGVAIIGMCLTGNFAVSLAADESVLAAFASQPSLPILGQGAHLSEDEAQAIRARLDIVGPMHAGRFAQDTLCRQSHFDALAKAINRDDKNRIIFHTLPGKGHSILTGQACNDAGSPSAQLLAEVMDYFDERLGS